jgi:hypothetical protein
MSKGHIPMIALSDFGFFARYTFDNRALTSGEDLKISSDWVNWEYLKTTFEKVTGQKAEIVYQSLDGDDSWFGNFTGTEYPTAKDAKLGDGSTTIKEWMTRWWSLYRDEKIKRDYEWIHRVNPGGHTLESWMRAEDYGNSLWQKTGLLKGHEDGGWMGLNAERIAQL